MGEIKYMDFEFYIFFKRKIVYVIGKGGGFKYIIELRRNFNINDEKMKVII